MPLRLGFRLLNAATFLQPRNLPTTDTRSDTLTFGDPITLELS